MSLYKVLVDGAEFQNCAYQEFIIITTSKKKAVEIVYKFVSGKFEEVPEYLNEERLEVEYIGDMANVKVGCCDEVIAYVYK